MEKIQWVPIGIQVGLMLIAFGSLKADTSSTMKRVEKLESLVWRIIFKDKETQ